jgi:hypothetical protein
MYRVLNTRYYPYRDTAFKTLQNAALLQLICYGFLNYLIMNIKLEIDDTSSSLIITIRHALSSKNRRDNIDAVSIMNYKKSSGG